MSDGNAEQVRDLVLTPTHAAMVFANARNDVDGFKKATEAAIEELIETFDDESQSVMDIILHVFSWQGELNFILVPAKDRSCLFVDLCEFDEGPVIEEGPLKGRTMKMPRPFSAGDMDDE